MAASVAVSSSPFTTLRHGEVIETSTVGILAESDRLHHLPPLGELVRARIDERLTAYAVVSFGQTGGIDPGRRAIRRGTSDSADNDVYSRHPELDHILRTVFRAAAVGYTTEGVIRHALPPLPIPLHYGVHPVEPDEVARFCERPEYLASLLAYRGEVSAEQLVSAHLRWVDGICDDGHAWLRDACRRLARLMKRDYDRLVVLLESIDPHGK
jgi:hypothetical protein